MIHHAGSAVKRSRTPNTLFTFIVGLVITLVTIVGALLLSFAVGTRTPFSRTKRYLVPGTEHEERPRTAGIGHLDTGKFVSVRSSDGRRYDGDEIALLIEIMEQAEHDGLSDLEVVIHYRKADTRTTYRTNFHTLRRYGQRMLGVSGWELALPRCYWSIDDQPPTGETAVPDAPAPPMTQAPLFEFREKRQIGSY